MSDALRLGVADGESRWIGVRRHQAALVIIGAGFVGEWLTQARGPLSELVAGVALSACAVPSRDGLTVGEWVRIGFGFVFRSRWSTIRASADGDVVTIVAHGTSTTRGFALQHRGRLDLSGRDRENALALAEFADTLATSDDTRHFSLHVHSTSKGVATLLAAPHDVSAPTGWTTSAGLALDVAGVVADAGDAWLLERWTYVRDAAGVSRVLRVRDFSAVPSGHNLLHVLQFASPTIDVAVHFDVVAGARARRLAARAVHRLGSDDATSRAAGFRRTAQSSRTLDRVRERESFVVEGSALLRIAVFVVIRSSTLQQLKRDVMAVTRSALESGLRCEAGLGRQTSWYCAQLPGAPGW
jgi:hypothetical protein